MFKKMIATLGIGGVVVAVSVASAAALDINDPAPVVQAADIVDVVCDPDGITVDGFGVELDTLTGHTFKASGIHDDCIGREIGVQVQRSVGAPVNVAAVIVDNDASAGGNNNTVSINFPSPLNLADIIGAHIVIG